MRINTLTLISIAFCLLAANTTSQPIAHSKKLVVNRGDSVSFSANELFQEDRNLVGAITSTNQAIIISPFFRSTASLDAVQDLSLEAKGFDYCGNFKDYGVGQVVALCSKKDNSSSLVVFDIQLRSELKDSAWNLKLSDKGVFTSNQGSQYVNHYYFETLDKDQVPHKSLYVIGVSQTSSLDNPILIQYIDGQAKQPILTTLKGVQNKDLRLVKVSEQPIGPVFLLYNSGYSMVAYATIADGSRSSEIT